MDNKIQSIDPDGSKSSKLILRKNGIILKPVAENESGEGLPYAPSGWPEQGDIWGWKVGCKTSTSGYWKSRYLYLPARLQNSSHKRRFKSKHSVQAYVQKEFPNADIDAFFSSFSWKIPAKAHTGIQGQANVVSLTSPKKTTERSECEVKVETVECKAGNWMCRLRLQAHKYTMPSSDCDICCSETGFCRDCCCILCCKVVNWAYGGYSFIRCEAKVNDSYICGHVAHVECALRSNMAGTVGGNSGLDVGYYCRRCDRRSDLILHVKKILQTCESLDSRDDIEMILNVGLCILGGSQEERSRRLLQRIELALAKVSHINGDKTRSGSNGVVQVPIGIAHSMTLNRTEPSKLEEKIGMALGDLRSSQENEYRLAKERLYAQRDFILDLYKHLQEERSQQSNVMNQLKKEIMKLKDMEEVAKGFGRVSKSILKENFGFYIAE